MILIQTKKCKNEFMIPLTSKGIWMTHKKWVMVLSLLTVVFFAGCSSSNEPDGPPVGSGNKNMLSYKVPDVPAKFETIEAKGTGKGEQSYYKNLPNVSSKLHMKHVQGYTRAYLKSGIIASFFTHTDGHTIMTNYSTDVVIHKYQRTGSTYDHPGGIQSIGQYLFIPYEEDGKSVVVVEDIENSLSEVNRFSFNHKAGAVGITDFTITTITNTNDTNKKSYYLLLVGDDDKYYAYIAEVSDSISISGLTFTSAEYFTLKDVNCQGFGLVTDTNNNVYMIATHARGSGAPYHDEVHLVRIKINIDSGGKKSVSHEKLKTKQLESSDGGPEGIHFRWGAGIFIRNDGTFDLLATRKYIESGKLIRDRWSTY